MYASNDVLQEKSSDPCAPLPPFQAVGSIRARLSVGRTMENGRPAFVTQTDKQRYSVNIVFLMSVLTIGIRGAIGERQAFPTAPLAL